MRQQLRYPARSSRIGEQDNRADSKGLRGLLATLASTGSADSRRVGDADSNVDLKNGTEKHLAMSASTKPSLPIQVRRPRWKANSTGCSELSIGSASAEFAQPDGKGPNSGADSKEIITPAVSSQPSGAVGPQS